MLVRAAVLFAYNGCGWEGLERNKGVNTIEATLLAAIASLLSPSQNSVLSNISRASSTEIDEHAARQVISFEVDTDSPSSLPSPEAVNDLLPASIRVFRIVPVNASFSARRTCEARTYEYLIPSYVFSPPPACTHYAYPDQDANDDDIPIPPSSRTNLFKTMKRGHSLARRQTLGHGASTATDNHDNGIPPDNDIPLASFPSSSASPNRPINAAVNPLSHPKNINSPPPPLPSHHDPMPNTLKRSQLSPEQIDDLKHSAEQRNVFVRIFSNFMASLSGKRTNRGSDNLKHTLSSTLQRSKSFPSGNAGPSSDKSHHGFAAASSSTNSRSNHLHMRSPSEDHSRFSNRDDGFVSTLKRTLSRHNKNFDPSSFDEPAQTIYHDPLNIPAPNSEQRASLRAYRLTESQKSRITNIIELFNGTHNWHNYIPGAAQDDSRCYIRILNIQTTEPELHQGMEWVRVKVQAHAFARYQVRKMMSMLIMVVRTNTPRSLVGNSYGFQKINLPEAPAFSLVLDEPHYNNYNFEAVNNASSTFQPVNFGECIETVEQFRHRSIHDAVYAYERDAMAFEVWVRSLDNYSFMYTYFLNERGVVGKPSQFARVKPVTAAVDSAQTVTNV